METNENPKKENKGKVGSDPEAAENFAEKHDFGIPSEDAAPDMTVEDRDFPGRPAGNKKTRSGASGKRTIGVGSTEGPDGKGSGGGGRDGPLRPAGGGGGGEFDRAGGAPPRP